MLTETVRHFIEIGIDYYTSGRFAARAKLMPICGNLCHHAVEMLLKGHLAQKRSPEELKQLKHNLPRLWTAYKGGLPAVTLTQFDETIELLDAFEDIRYPDEIVSKGAQIV